MKQVNYIKIAKSGIGSMQLRMRHEFFLNGICFEVKKGQLVITKPGKKNNVIPKELTVNSTGWISCAIPKEGMSIEFGRHYFSEEQLKKGKIVIDFADQKYFTMKNFYY